ncbi:unnamed protein product [Calicophoron daubneyi]|uniref:Uncharacterized protein n=1 Tax=Calicophoron daubneyi TaxID=300641 RepID=A0AAV2T576_CALDB
MQMGFNSTVDFMKKKLELWSIGFRKRHEDDAFQLNFLPHLRKTIIRKLIRARQITRSTETVLIIEDIIKLLGENDILNDASIPTHAQKQRQQERPEVCPEYWDDPRKGSVYFENVYKTKPCKRIPLEKLVEILIYVESCEDGKHLLDRIRLVYPNMTVRLAVGEIGEESAICRLLESAHPLFNVKDNASTWLKLAQIASSKYALVGRNMVEFTFHTNIDRLLRVVNNLSVSVAGGSVRLEPEGRWYAGCYQIPPSVNTLVLNSVGPHGTSMVIFIYSPRITLFSNATPLSFFYRLEGVQPHGESLSSWLASHSPRDNEKSSEPQFQAIW